MRAPLRAGVLALIGGAVALALPSVVLRPLDAHAATTSPPSITLTPTPCSPRPANGGCSLAPKTLAVTFPAGAPGTTPTAGLSGVDVTWTTTGRPAAAPVPANTSVVLSLNAGGCSTPPKATTTTCTWPWPSGLEATGSAVVLNGTYLVTPCSSGVTGSDSTPPVSTGSTGSTTTTPPPKCTAPGSPGAAHLGMSVPPAVPTGVHVSAASSATTSPVTVNWALGSEPDLAAYTVTRNDLVVFTCTLHGAVIAGAAPCASKLTYTDHPGISGHISYGVQAQRFGLGGNAAQDVVSLPSVAMLTLGSPGSVASLPPIQIIGIPKTPPVVVPSTPAGTGPPPRATSPSTVAGYGNLPYGSQAHSAAAVAGANGSQPGAPDVNRIALIAAGLLVAAIAAHLLYLRGAVNRYQLVHGSTAAPAHRKSPSRLHVRWGAWPPVVREE